MKKIQLLFVAMMLLLSVDVKANDIPVNSSLDLYNPDVRKCLLEASESEGWELKALYQNAKEELVYIFVKGNEKRTYTSL